MSDPTVRQDLLRGLDKQRAASGGERKAMAASPKEATDLEAEAQSSEWWAKNFWGPLFGDETTTSALSRGGTVPVPPGTFGRIRGIDKANKRPGTSRYRNEHPTPRAGERYPYDLPPGVIRGTD